MAKFFVKSLFQFPNLAERVLCRNAFFAAKSKWAASALFLLCGLFIFGDAAKAQQQSSDSATRPAATIHKISIEAHDIFDPEERVPLAGLVNFLHIRTRKNVIRRELLFRRQQPFDQALVNESERNLRALGIFADVDILTDATEPDSLQVVVHTRDKWSTKLNTTYKLVGGVHFWGISLIEDNLAGQGKTIDLGYNHSSDRIFRQVLCRDPRLLGSRFAGNFKVQNNSDFDALELTFSRPFFAWNTRWGFGLAYENTNGVYRQFQDGELIAAPRLDENAFQMIVNLYRGETTKRHFMLGVSLDKSQVGESRRENNLVGVGFGVLRRRYHELRNVDAYERTEDVPSGMLAEVVFGMNVKRDWRRLGDPYFLSRFKLASATPHGAGYSFSAMLQTFYTGRRFRDSLFESEAKAFRSFGRHVLVGRIGFARLANFTVARQLVLGDDKGLRGYPLRARTGSKLFLLNLEDRIATDLKLLVFRFGLTAFADVGHVWEAGEPVRPEDLQASLGLGLRIGNARFTGAINRLDLAYNLAEKAWRVSISVGSYFSAYTPLDFFSDFQTRRLRANL